MQGSFAIQGQPTIKKIKVLRFHKMAVTGGIWVQFSASDEKSSRELDSLNRSHAYPIPSPFINIDSPESLTKS